MTDPSELIKQAATICEAATPGPWHALDTSSLSVRERDLEDDSGWLEIEGVWACGPREPAGMIEADATFIAAARTLVPELAAALSELQIQLSDVVCKKIEDMSEAELRSLCLLNGTTLEQTATHTRYVIKTALRQVDLENKLAEITRERDEARAELAKLKEIIGNG